MEFRTGNEAAMGLDETTADHATSPEPAASKNAAVKMDRSDKGSEALVAEKVAEAMAGAAKAAPRIAVESRSLFTSGLP